MEMRQAERYSAYRDELALEYLREDGNVEVDDAENVLKRLLRLVQCASNPALIDEEYDREPAKLPLLRDLCQELIPDSKLIIWTGFVANVEWLATKLASYSPLTVHGGLTMSRRNDAICEFVESRHLILIATPGAAKEGLTLTAANHAIFFDRSFSLDDYLQAQDRIHRISQTRETFVHNLIAQNTIDEWIDSLLSAKYRAAQMAQGDISATRFRNSFQSDVGEMLRAVLRSGR